MKKVSLVLLGGLFFAEAASGSSRIPTFDCSTADLQLASPRSVLDCRYELETRQAGGPRREVLEGLLKKGKEIDDPMWGKRVIDACVAELIDCGDFVASAMALAEREKAHPESARGMAKRIREEAALQAMAPRQRRAFYLEALTKGFAEEDGVRLDYRNAALRLLQERMPDLTRRVEEESSKWPNSPSDYLSNQIAIARALSSPNPQVHLLVLVRQGVLQPTDSSRELLGKQALNELRRLNLEGAAEELKEVLELYEPAKEKHDKERKEVLEKARQENRHLLHSERHRLAEDAYLGVLGKEIIKAIGDLGDREFERKALGGRTLWDQVHDTEQELVRQGKLQRSEMVSRQP